MLEILLHSKWRQRFWFHDGGFHLQMQSSELANCVQETVEPLMEQYKPPGLIKKMYFKNLSFGDAPFKVENVWVEDEGEKHVLMEVHKLLCQMSLTVHANRLAGL